MTRYKKALSKPNDVYINSPMPEKRNKCPIHLAELPDAPIFRWEWIVILLIAWIGIGIAPMFLGGRNTACATTSITSTADTGNTPGTFGDMFGMVNSLFSGLAFLALIHTIRLQKHEIRLQRDELTMTREELRRGADAQKESAEALALQVIIASVTARLSSALSRRSLARESLAHMQQRKADRFATAEVNGIETPIEEALENITKAIRNRSEEIDRLTERLRIYDAELTAKLDESKGVPSPVCTCDPNLPSASRR